jgi:polar amino acid transport system substrate-binding protein
MKTRPSLLAITFMCTLTCLGAATSSHAWQIGNASASPKPALRYIQKAEVSVSTKSTYSVSSFQTSLGKALADQMGRPVQFVGLPRKRLISGLEAGEGDILCGYLPAWISGQFDWSRPFIPVSDLVLASDRVPEPRDIGELKGKRIGTVLGFRYPELEQQLGRDFKRDDGPSNDVSLHKLLAGRYDYLATTRSLVDAYASRGQLPRNSHILVVKEFQTMCAISRHGNVTPDELNAAIDVVVKSGTLSKLLRAR